ncbi:MAG: hypothetical protein GF347_01715 [Candidatus Moranbacteria bacterium]|nr:hypothetical protein [Candidatus Moranbacteria bacterium]
MSKFEQEFNAKEDSVKPGEEKGSNPERLLNSERFRKGFKILTTAATLLIATHLYHGKEAEAFDYKNKDLTLITEGGEYQSITEMTLNERYELPFEVRIPKEVETKIIESGGQFTVPEDDSDKNLILKFPDKNIDFYKSTREQVKIGNNFKIVKTSIMSGKLYITAECYNGSSLSVSYDLETGDTKRYERTYPKE